MKEPAKADAPKADAPKAARRRRRAEEETKKVKGDAAKTEGAKEMKAPAPAPEVTK